MNRTPKPGSKPARAKKKTARPYAGLLLAIPVVVGALVVAIVLVGWLLFRSRGSGGGDQDRQARGEQGKVNEVPPVAWTLKPGLAPPAALPDQFALPDTQTAIPSGWENLFVVNKQGKWVYGRFDLKTGQAIGETVALSGPYDVNSPHAFSPTGAAVFANPQKPHLDYYEPGQQAPKPMPELAVRTLRAAVSMRGADQSWFDFSADGKLWHLLDGKLAAWDLKAGKVVLEAPSRYVTSQTAAAEPCALMGPDRRWLIAQVEGKYLEVLDTATGECRGRFGGEGGWRALVVSLDGKRLAGLRLPPIWPGPSTGDVQFELHDWDLATGEKKGFTTLTYHPGLPTDETPLRLHWYAPDRLAFLGPLANNRLGGPVIDLKNRMNYILIDLPRGVPSPDGRFWSSQADGRVVSVKIPTDPPDGEPALRPGDALRIESRCGDAAIDRRVMAMMTETLARMGYKVEPGGWTLQVSGQLEETKEKLTGKFSEYAVPMIRAKYELLAPDGTVAASKDQIVNCPLGKFYKSFNATPGGVFQPGGAAQVNYDFGGRNPSVAMREEVWSLFVVSMPEYPWPRTVWRSGGKFVPLPIKVAGPN
jgi:hypothetical protein